MPVGEIRYMYERRGGRDRVEPVCPPESAVQRAHSKTKYIGDFPFQGE